MMMETTSNPMNINLNTFYTNENQLRALWPQTHPSSMINLNSFNQTDQPFASYGSSIDSLYQSDQLTSTSESISPTSLDQPTSFFTNFDFGSLPQLDHQTIQTTETTDSMLPEQSTLQSRTNKRNVTPGAKTRVNSYCETVAVESSGHVAQIVGKNGCKIKHLRAKYGTYIHTPSTTDEPVFIIKGQRDKVMEVKQEIIKADNHFSSIKEARNTKIAKMIDSEDATTIRLFIPNRYIGLVVGRNGWFVKALQQKYQIYIETPKFELCCYFQLYGPKERLQTVKKSIFDHILKKTGIRFTEQIDKDSGDIYLIE